MTASRKVVQSAVVVVLSGAAGFAGGCYFRNDEVFDLAAPLAHVAQMEMDELAFAFAPTPLVEEMIAAEPPQPPELAHAEERVALLRTLRLAVVAATPEKRERLLKQAEAKCRDCDPETVRKMFERYAQGRLVPPGDDVECNDCKRKRRALPRL